MSRYTWTDFESDDSSDNVSGKYILTINDPDGEEMAVIVHRASRMFPLDGVLAREKRKDAQRIVDALNAYTESGR